MNENQNDYVDINAHDNYPDSEQKIEIPTMKVIPLKKICMTIGELPTSYLETMTYYEMLVWFIEYLKNNIIPTINNNASAVQEVQSVVLSLQSYINDYKDSIDSDVEELEEYMNNYFENLDVQEEINNKLDQMLEDGVLTEIIQQFLQSTAIWCFDNVTDMKQATNLINGSFAKTLGYYAANDGGEATYKIRNKTNDDVPDDSFIIQLNTTTLVAELIIENDINANSCGMSTALTDNSTILAKCIAKATTLKREIFINGGIYTFINPITVPTNISIKGVAGNPFNESGTILYYTGSDLFMEINHYSILKNIMLKGDETNNGLAIGCAKLENVTLKDFAIGVQLGTVLNSPNAYLENVFCYNCTLGYKLDSDYTDESNPKYCQNTTLLHCRCYICLNGYFINDYAIHLISINAETGQAGGIPVEFGPNAKSCTLINSYLENKNDTKELIIDEGAKYNEIKGFRYLGWYSRIQNNSDGTNIITCPSINNQTVQFQHGKTCFDYFGLVAKDDFASIYGIEKTSDLNIKEGVTYGTANIFKSYDTKLIHRLTDYTARNRANGTFSNPSVTQTVTPQSINVPSKGYQNISFTSSYFSTTPNTRFIAMALTNLDLIINFYKVDNNLIMHLYNPTDANITSDPIPVNVLCWEQA